MTTQHSSRRRWVRRTLQGLLGLLALTLAAGSTYELMGRRRAAIDFPPPGKLVDIGGRRIQIDCRGAGSPTVVFENGLDTYGSLGWSLVHDEVAKTTRACAYSRAGIMWSEPSQGPHGGISVAEDLHAALGTMGERPPFVLVGHSLGGPYAMIYTKRYAPEVAGLVFVDASHPDQRQRIHEFRPPRSRLAKAKAWAALSWTGLLRVIAATELREEVARAPDMSRRLTEQVMAAYASTSIHGEVEEMEASDATLAEAGTFRQLGDRPLVVLTSMAPLPDQFLKERKLTREQATEVKAQWRTLHDEEASWSSRGQHQLINDASHYIQFDRPDVVIAAVRTVVASVRDARSAAPAP
ncbi:MAG TPA: alpha/beta hydrolase [Myxococcaceae bacterium]|jgi:pimeloyl-ACP methyl ester carboxylesterase